MSVKIGTPLSQGAKKVLLCGSGELGKEVAIELQRFGVEVIAVDRYENAPAMQVAHRSHVINMLDGAALRRVIESEKPDLIVPEIEAIATDTLAELEHEGFTVIPTAKAAQLTMNREGIRRLAAEELGLKTSVYEFAQTKQEYLDAIDRVGLPCIIKPIMSSSGKGQSLVRDKTEIADAWDYAQQGGRAGKGKVIIEGFVDFDFEITLLTIRHRGEFALHARAILDLPIPQIKQLGASASSVILVSGESQNVQFGNLEKALSVPNTQLRLFGKPEVSGRRRMGVALATGDSIEQAREMANKCAATVDVAL